MGSPGLQIGTAVSVTVGPIVIGWVRGLCVTFTGGRDSGIETGKVVGITRALFGSENDVVVGIRVRNNDGLLLVHVGDSSAGIEVGVT